MFFFTAIVLISIQVVSAEELLTKNYRIVVDRRCSEGNVICDNVTYLGINRKSGKSIKLIGSTWHHMCPDGITPCHFLGYVFKNGNITYYVGGDATLKITQGNKVLLEEKEIWKD